MADDVVQVPEHLTTAEQIAEFVRQEIYSRGGDPDTAYPLAVENPSSAPFDGTLSVQYSYDSPPEPGVYLDAVGEWRTGQRDTECGN